MYGSIVSEKPSPLRGDRQHVLVVVDDPEVAELLTTTLELAGYEVGTAGSGTEGMARVARHRFDLVVLDATLSDLTDFGRGRRVAPVDRPPVLFLTACDSLHALVPELGLGAEDYVTKPFRIAEFLARAQVLLRGHGAGRDPGGNSGRHAGRIPGRNPGRRDGMPRYGDLILDDAACQARRGRRAIDLTPAEYRLLRHLLANADRVLSKEQISRHVWGEFRADNAIEKLVSRLRRKVDREEPALIHTRRGFGYWLGCPGF
ncbi:response regulator transcription factor [Streptomyces montanus]|uniref:Response regulator transcription factor n=1 Tax=Streptomyces montanus TaxID=2580423 RepID=A0A5R9FPG4_9ACTN|nr:response regulator transcription factor [Streptomyces montanus]TLS43378.1 response regulator transcription factor [Streptomyces montanus]